MYSHETLQALAADRIADAHARAAVAGRARRTARGGGVAPPAPPATAPALILRTTARPVAPYQQVTDVIRAV